MRRKNSGNLAVKFAFALCLAIFYLNLINAESISLDYPNAVSYDEEFNIKITLEGFSETAYSVKIEILNPAGERIAQIYDESESKFKSCYYYANNIEFSGSEAEIKMRINKEYNGLANISIGIKNSDGKVRKFGGYSIEVSGDGKEADSKEESEDKGDKNENNANNKKELDKSGLEASEDYADKENIIELNNADNFNEEIAEESEKIIYLGSVTKTINTENTKDIKSEKNRVIYKSISEKIKEYAIYAFAIFCIFILTFKIISWTKK